MGQVRVISLLVQIRPHLVRALLLVTLLPLACPGASQAVVQPLLDLPWHGWSVPAPPATQNANRREVAHRIEKGETFASILSSFGVPSKDIPLWQRAARHKTSLGALRTDHRLTLVFEDDTLRGIRYDVDDDNQLVIDADPTLELNARLEPLPVRIDVRGARGTIQDSFYRSARRGGLSDSVINAMVDLLGWKLDFRSDIHTGDRFRVLYEERTTLDGRRLRPGRILAVEFNGLSGSVSAFLYEDEHGTSIYLDEHGQPLEPTLLRYPLEFARISSAFSDARLHPILKRTRPHMGVDFSAPVGTPVRAVAAGTVTFADWKGDFGRHIEVDHGNDFVSTYSHLRGFASGVQSGTQVRLGQLIGWVGVSGLTTGPHLHFAIFDNGRYVNPLTLRQPPQAPAIDTAKFHLVRTALTNKFSEVLASYRAAPSTPPIVLSAVAQAQRLGPVALTI